MRFWVACVCLHLAACGPVLLLGDAPGSKSAAPVTGPDGGLTDAGSGPSGLSGAAGDLGTGAAQPRDGAVPYARLKVTPSDCGRCFDLVANAAGGTPPYEYQWEDGSRSQTRRVCVQAGQRPIVTVVVQDRNAVHSAPSVTELAAEDVDAACPAETPGRRLCIQNPSFEGTTQVNVGQNFDAVPWSTCSNDSSTANTPDVASDALVVIGNVPKVVNGSTYVALGQGEQISQALCEEVRGGTKLAFKLDVSRIDLTPGDTTKMFLEVWGGIAADCTQRQLLWASPALASSWTNFCIPIEPTQYMNQLTLRGKTDVASPFPEYMVVDNLVPVDRCP